MNDGVIKEEDIEEGHNFTFKNGEYVEVKQEEIEEKPEYHLEKEIKTETNDDSFEDVKLEPTERDSPIEMVFDEGGFFQCQICQKRMPRRLLKFIKSEDEKTVLSEIFKTEGLAEMNRTYVCYSHIQTIIDENDGKLKLPKTPYEKLLRSFIRNNKILMRRMQTSRVRRQYCHVCCMSKDYSELYRICSNRIRIVLMIGCMLRGTHSVDQAKDYITKSKGLTCYSHCKESIDMVFEHLGIRNIEDFWNCPAGAMDSLMDIAKSVESNFTVDQFCVALYSLFLKKPKIPSSL
ncbi:unnamed protein product [Caenorhabditis nigoni]